MSADPGMTVQGGPVKQGEAVSGHAKASKHNDPFRRQGELQRNASIGSSRVHDESRSQSDDPQADLATAGLPQPSAEGDTTATSVLPQYEAAVEALRLETLRTNDELEQVTTELEAERQSRVSTARAVGELKYQLQQAEVSTSMPSLRQGMNSLGYSIRADVRLHGLVSSLSRP